MRDTDFEGEGVDDILLERFFTKRCEEQKYTKEDLEGLNGLKITLKVRF